MSQTQIDEAKLRTLIDESISRMLISEDTNIGKSNQTEVDKAIGRMLISETVLADLQDLLAWWRARKETLQAAMDVSRETERITFHVERRWIELIRKQADLDGQTITQVVNRAFMAFFTVAANPHAVHRHLQPLFTEKSI